MDQIQLVAVEHAPVERAPHAPNTPTARPAPADAPALEVRWARHLDEVRQAQRLRYSVFAQEMGAQLPPARPGQEGLDIDEFDDYCEHLLVTTSSTQEAARRVVGTYRVMLPQAAARAGRYYTESEFDLKALRPMRARMAELGRSCIAPQWRTGGVILMLWGHLARFLHANRVHHAIGCASIPMADGGHNAARLWEEIRHQHLTAPSLRVTPHVPLPVEHLGHLGGREQPADWPALIKGYVRCGAKVMGPPAWDPDFGTADLPILLDLEGMSASYRRRLLQG